MVEPNTTWSPLPSRASRITCITTPVCSMHPETFWTLPFGTKVCAIWHKGIDVGVPQEELCHVSGNNTEEHLALDAKE